MNSLLRKRLIAMLIDWFCISLYAAVLCIITLSVCFFLNTVPVIPHPLIAELLGFFTLTVPVFLYYFVSENGTSRATIGKRSVGIYVTSRQGYGSKQIFIRNALKLLPWEIAHSGVHWLLYLSGRNQEIPYWVWVLLVIPQVVALLYLCTIIYYKGESSLYDKIAMTRIKPAIE